MFDAYVCVQPKAITVMNVYGVGSPKIPKGYRAIGFRPPKNNELWLSTSNVHTVAIKATADYGESVPRIILIPKPRRIVFEETGTKRFIPLPGEYVFIDDQKTSVGPWSMFRKVSDGPAD